MKSKVVDGALIITPDSLIEDYRAGCGATPRGFVFMWEAFQLSPEEGCQAVGMTMKTYRRHKKYIEQNLADLLEKEKAQILMNGQIAPGEN